jgi:hypothetical protein
VVAVISLGTFIATRSLVGKTEKEYSKASDEIVDRGTTDNETLGRTGDKTTEYEIAEIARSTAGSPAVKTSLKA